MNNWIADGKLEKVAEEGEYGPRPTRPWKLDRYKEIIAVRLALATALAATWLKDRFWPPTPPPQVTSESQTQVP